VSYEREEMVQMGSVEMMGRVGNFSENGTGCLIVFKMGRLTYHIFDANVNTDYYMDIIQNFIKLYV